MADKKISQLTGATTPLAGTEVLPIVQGGSTVKVSVDNLTTGKAVSASQLTIENNSTNNAVRITQTGTGNALVIEDSSNPDATPFVVDANGNVGVGVTPSSWQTSSYKVVQFPAGVSLFGQIGTPSSILMTNAYIDAAYSTNYVVSAAASYYWQTVGEHRWYTAPSGTAGTAAPFTQVMKMDTSGNLTVNTGNLVIGTAGKGIDFSVNTNAAGMTSELLNDYEEGTWTPVIIGSTDAGTATYSSQVGSYTKCGRSVFVTCSVSWTGHTGTGDLRITGLPFATASAYQSTVNLGYITDIAFNASATPLIRTSTSSTVLFLAQLASGGASISAIPISSAGNILLSSTYIV